MDVGVFAGTRSAPRGCRMVRVEQTSLKSAARAGVRWGVIGGVVGFLVSLLGSLAGMVAAGFVGVWCGRQAAEASKAPGALLGFVGGAVAAPVFVVGASAGALVTARGFGTEEIAAMLSDIVGTTISPDQAWRIFLASTLLAAVLQAGILVAASAAAGAVAARRG